MWTSCYVLLYLVCEITTNRVLSRARRERRESVLSKGVRERFMIATVVVENGKTCTSVLMLALIPPETVGAFDEAICRV